jgi:hypothetical protein
MLTLIAAMLPIVITTSSVTNDSHLIFNTNSEHSEYVTSEASNSSNIRVKFILKTIDKGVVSESPSIALDSNDLPHIVYLKSSGDLGYAYYNGVSWNFETVDGNVTSIGGDIIDIDSYDFPHVTYTVENGVKYAYYNGTSWVIQMVKEETYAFAPSISLDSNNKPHISYFEIVSDTLRYAYYDGFSWQIQTIDNYGTTAWSQSIAVDSYGRPHIVYSKGPTSQIQNLTYAHLSGNSWVIETIDKNAGYLVSIALDSQNNLHISYRNPSRGLKYAYYNGTLWNRQIVSGSERDNVYYNSIDLDSKGNPHISYYNMSPSLLGRSLRYAYYNGTSWNVITVDKESVSPGNSIALDSKDQRYIMYVYLTAQGNDLRCALGNIQFLTNLIFKDATGTTTLYIEPTEIRAIAPNNTLTTFTYYSNIWLDNGTWVLKRIIWQSTNVKPLIDPTYTTTPGGTWTINCRVYWVNFTSSFLDNEGKALYINPSSFKLTFPNGTTSESLSVEENYLIQNGTTVWSSIVWQETEVVPEGASFDPANGNPTVSCRVYSLTVDPVFYDNTGTVIVQPSSWSIAFPNGTIRTVSSPVTYNQTQTGNYSIVSIIWKDTEVVPEMAPTVLLASDMYWSPNINCLLPTSVFISLSSSVTYIGFKVKINGSLTCNEVGLSGASILISYSVTAGESWDDITLVETTSDGNYSAVWIPSATGNYLVRAVWAGNETYPKSNAVSTLAVTSFENQYVFSVVSNSTVSYLAFNSTSRELSFIVSGPSGTYGYVDVTIAKALVFNITDLKVYLNGNEIGYTVASTEDSWLLHFTYAHSTNKVLISLGPSVETTPDYGIFFINGIAGAIGVTIAVAFIILYRRRRSKT